MRYAQFLFEIFCCLILKFCFALLDCTAPYKGILIGIGFYLCSVDKQVLELYLVGFSQQINQLSKQSLYTASKVVLTESCNGVMVLSLFSSEQIHKCEIEPASFFYLSGRIDMLRICIYHYLK